MPRVPIRPQAKKPDLTIDHILAWCDAFHAAHRRWPTRKDGMAGLVNETWSGIDACLKGGFRGLDRGSSLAKLLLAKRGRRHQLLLPKLTPALILTWADAHYRHTGDWPTQYSGDVATPTARRGRAGQDGQPSIPGEDWGFTIESGTQQPTRTESSLARG
jgi:hypothetical protein